MSAMKTGIQWTDRTWNPVVGCSRVSEGCRNCYAETMARRIACAADARDRKGESACTETQRAYQAVVRTKPMMQCPPPGEAPPSPARGEGAGTDGERVRLPQWNGKVVLIEEALIEPLGWKKPAHGGGLRVFVNSMSDLFHENLPFEAIDRVFAVMALCSGVGGPHLTFQVLTKRPERMAEYLAKRTARDGGPTDNISHEMERMNGWKRIEEHLWPLPNVWLGTSVEDQDSANRRIPHLLRCPVGEGAVRFLSCEPLLGETQLGELRYQSGGIGWVIVGGESGHGARPCRMAWIDGIVGQCAQAGVPVFVKQIGARPVATIRFDCGAGGHVDEDQPYRCIDTHGGDMEEWPECLRVREMPGEGTRAGSPCHH